MANQVLELRKSMGGCGTSPDVTRHTGGGRDRRRLADAVELFISSDYDPYQTDDDLLVEDAGSSPVENDE